MLVVLALLLASTLSAPSPVDLEVETCPAGPIFGLVPQSDRLDATTRDALKTYARNMNSELWRHGWITVSPTTLHRDDERTRNLAERRKQRIRTEMRKLGIADERVRFEYLHFGREGDGRSAEDAYASTLSVPKIIFNRIIPPDILC